MKRSLLIYLAAFFGTCFWQCESVVEIDDASFTPKLVINSQMSAENRFEVHVSTSASPTGQTSKELPDGLEVEMVNLTEGSEVPLYRENGIYVAAPDVNVIPGSEYMIRAMAPGYSTVTAMTKIPQNLAIDSIVVDNVVIEPSQVTPSKTNVSYTIRVAFPEGSTDYLHIIFTQTSTIRGNSSTPPATLEYDLTPEFPEESGYVKHVEEGVLVSLGDLNEKELEFTFKDFTIDVVGEELGHIEMEVRTVSEEYYEFFVSVARQLSTIKDPFAEPVPVFNNVEGGYGNFSGFNSVVYEFSLF